MATRAAVPPSLHIGTPSPEHTFQVLEQRLDAAEVDTKALVEQLASMGFSAENAQPQSQGDVQEPLSPYKPRIADTEILQRNYEALVSRVCKAESAIQTMKLNILRYQTDRDLNRNEKQNIGEKLAAATEAFEMELSKLNKDLVQSRQDLKDALGSKRKMEEEIRRLQTALQAATSEKAGVLAEAGEFKSVKQKLNKRVSDLREELSRESRLRASLEESHNTLLARIKDLESIVDSERQQVKSMSSDYTTMKKEMVAAKDNFTREHEMRVQIENTMKGLVQQRDKIQNKVKSVESDKQLLLDEITKMKTQYGALHKQLDTMGALVTEKKDVHSHLEAENKQLHETVKAKTAENAKLIATYEAQLESERSGVESKIQNSEQVQQLSNQLKDISRAKGHLEQKVSHLESQLSSATESTHQQDSRITQLQADLLRYQKISSTEKQDKEKALHDKEKLLDEVNQAVDSMSDERARLQAEVDKQKLDVSSLEQAKKQLHDENARLLERISALQMQEVSQKQVQHSISEMQEQKNKLAYDNGKIQSKLEKLQSEMETLSASKLELTQLRSVHSALEGKFTKTSSDLNTAEIKIQQLENQIRQLHTSATRKEKDFDLALKSRDEALKEKEHVTLQLKSTEDNQDMKALALQRSLDESKADNKKMASTLENVMTAHNQLQSNVEKLQTELGKKDSQLAQLQMERAKSQETMHELQRKVNTLQDKVLVSESIEATEVEPLRRSLNQYREDNRKMASTMEELMNTNAKLQNALQEAEHKAESKQKKLQELQKARGAETADSQREVKSLEEKLFSVQEQHQKDKEKIVKKSSRELTDVRKQLDELYGKNGELSRTNSELRGRMAELEGQVKEQKVRVHSQKVQLEQVQKARKHQDETITELKGIQKQIHDLEKAKEHYSRKNKEQAETIKQFMSQVSGLQEELRTLSKTYSESTNLLKKHEAALEREKQNNAQFKRKYKEAKQREQDLLEIHRKTEEKLLQANTESLQIATNLQDAHKWFKSKFDSLQNELKGSRNSATNLEQVTFQQRVLLESERQKADEMATKAKQLIKESRKQISRLADLAEKSQHETTVKLHSMHSQLQTERNYARLAEEKYNQLKESSLRQTEDLAKELNFPHSPQSISSISFQ